VRGELLVEEGPDLLAEGNLLGAEVEVHDRCPRSLARRYSRATAKSWPPRSPRPLSPCAGPDATPTGAGHTAASRVYHGRPGTSTDRLVGRRLPVWHTLARSGAARPATDA